MSIFNHLENILIILIKFTRMKIFKKIFKLSVEFQVIEKKISP